MIIRKISENDAEKYLNMLRRLDNETNNMMFEPGERKNDLNEMKKNISNKLLGGSVILIAEDEGDIVGFLSAEVGFANRIRHSAYIVTGVLEDYRGKGIGTLLFDRLENWAIENNITRLELTVIIHNENAINLYKKMGFKIEGIKERSLIIDNIFVDEYYMARIL